MNRQQFHRQAPPPEIAVVLGEAPLREAMGGRAVMEGQWEKLVTMSFLPHIDLRILPFSAGPHPGVEEAFTILGIEPISLSQTDSRAMIERVAPES
jgi:hypothetical protein